MSIKGLGQHDFSIAGDGYRIGGNFIVHQTLVKSNEYSMKHRRA
jgi:hypothetical protein